MSLFKVGDLVSVKLDSPYFDQDYQIPKNSYGVIEEIRHHLLDGNHNFLVHWDNGNNSYRETDLVHYGNKDITMQKITIDLTRSDLDEIPNFLDTLKDLGYKYYEKTYDYKRENVSKLPYIMLNYGNWPSWLHYRDNLSGGKLFAIPQDWNEIFHALSKDEHNVKTCEHSRVFTVLKKELSTTAGIARYGIFTGSNLSNASGSKEVSFISNGIDRRCHNTIQGNSQLTDGAYPFHPDMFTGHIPNKLIVSFDSEPDKNEKVKEMIIENHIRLNDESPDIFISGMDCFPISPSFIDGIKKHIPVYPVSENYELLLTLLTKRKERMSQKLRAFSIPIKGVNPHIITAWIQIIEGLGYRLDGDNASDKDYMLINGGNVSSESKTPLTYSYSDVNNKRNVVIDIVSEFDKALDLVSIKMEQAVVKSEHFVVGENVVLHDISDIDGFNDLKYIKEMKSMVVGSTHVVMAYSEKNNTVLLRSSKYLFCADRFKRVSPGDPANAFPDGTYVIGNSDTTSENTQGRVFNGLVFNRKGQSFPFIMNEFSKMSPEYLSDYLLSQSPFKLNESVLVELPTGKTIETKLKKAWVIYDDNNTPRLVFSDKAKEESSWFEESWLVKYHKIIVDGVDLRLKTTFRNNSLQNNVELGDKWVSIESLLRLSLITSPQR